MEKVVQEAYDKLILTIRNYRPDTSLKMIEDSFNMAYDAHKNQTRKTGEPYIMHPLEVGIILAEIRTDLESIAAGLLHDVVEDTHLTSEEISARFGEDVAHLVAGVTKIEKVAYVSKTDRQAENYRKMFFHMSQDVRVLLIKIADRLHNMRTIDGHSEEKQREIAQETLDIYAPLAHRLGIARLRYELEDLGFKYTDRKFYDELSAKIAMKQSEREEIVEQLMKEIRVKIDEASISARVDGRPKRFYSIYKKMISKDKTLEQLFDLYGVRVLVNEVSDCWKVIGVLHEMYMPVPGRLKDYIAMKKANGYQSLHTTLMGPGEPFEAQVRTYQMQAVAEFGIAAHWKYKEGGKSEKNKWLQEIMDWQRNMSAEEDSDEFLDALKMDLSAFQEKIYCFTPRGEIVQLLEGSCAIDFAYSIHSAVGNRMTGARVNGKMVPVSHKLCTGDQVEITTSQNIKGPSRDWLKLVKTNAARTKITQWFNKESREDNIQKGREALEAAARNEGHTLDCLLAEGRGKEVLGRYNCKALENLFAMIGVGGLKENMVINHLCREYEKTLPPPSDEELIQNLIEAGEKAGKNKTTSGINVRGVGDTAVRFAKCCGPFPGDEILGFVTRGRGLTVHRTDCINIINMDEFDRRRLIDAQWHSELEKGTTYHTEMRITCDVRDGLLPDISRTISDEKINVTNMTMRTVQSEVIFNISFEIANSEQLKILTKKLQNISGVCETERVSSL